jgi:hypothetical protein
MPIVELKKSIIESIISSENEILLTRIREILQKDSSVLPVHGVLPILGNVDLEELQQQFADDQEEEYSWDEVLQIVKQTGK